jgi:hypothetical protein
VQTVFNVLDANGRSDPRVAVDLPVHHLERYAQHEGPPQPFELRMPNDLQQEIISGEPNLKLCSWSFAEENGGFVTLALLYALRHIEGVDLRFVVIDVRTHHMQKGDMPSSNTTWHTDSERSFHRHSQHVNTIHYLFLSGPPFTEFVLDRNIPFDPRRLKQLPKFYAPAGKIIRYNSTELHRARYWPEAAPQWRYFFRASTFPEAPRRKDVFENKVYTGPTPCSRPR